MKQHRQTEIDAIKAEELTTEVSMVVKVARRKAREMLKDVL
jgi:hypothetical protein